MHPIARLMHTMCNDRSLLDEQMLLSHHSDEVYVQYLAISEQQRSQLNLKVS